MLYLDTALWEDDTFSKRLDFLSLALFQPDQTTPIRAIGKQVNLATQA